MLNFSGGSPPNPITTPLLGVGSPFRPPLSFFRIGPAVDPRSPWPGEAELACRGPESSVKRPGPRGGSVSTQRSALADPLRASAVKHWLATSVDPSACVVGKVSVARASGAAAPALNATKVGCLSFGLTFNGDTLSCTFRVYWKVSAPPSSRQCVGDGRAGRMSRWPALHDLDCRHRFLRCAVRDC